VSSLLGLVLGVSLIIQLITNRAGASHIPLAVPVWLGYLALSAFTIFWSIAPHITASDFQVLASQVVLFVALVLTRFDRETLHRFGTAILTGGVLVVVYFLLQATVIGGVSGSRASGGARYGDDLLGANNQAAAMLLPIAIAATRAMSGDDRRSRGLNGLATVMLLIGVIMTGSRGGLLSTLVVLAVVLFLGPAKRLVKIGVAAGGALLVAVVLIVQPAGLGSRQVDHTEKTTTSNVSSGRTDIWAVGLSACKSYCLSGAGGGNFGQVYQAELASVPQARVQERGSTFEPHNIFLLALIEVGIGGLVLLVIGLGTAFSGAIRLPRDLRAPPVAALVGTVVSSFFLSNLEFKFFWAVLAFVAVSETVGAAERRDRDRAVPAELGRLEPATGGTHR
jgi:O-antigen ligase